MRRFLLVLILLSFGWGGLGAQAPLPPPPQQWVTDSEGFLSPPIQARLNQRLATYQRATGHSVLVWIGASSAGEPLENFTVKAFQSWKVGRKGLDDGLVLFILAKDHKVRLEVGYGLEGQVPDALASRIIQESILPSLKDGDRDGAVSAGTSAILRTLGGEVDAPARSGRAPLSLGSYIVLGLLALGLAVLFITNPGLAVWLLFNLLAGGRGGGGGGRDDGFSGGGGRSGGGGASGSW